MVISKKPDAMVDFAEVSGHNRFLHARSGFHSDLI